MLSSFTLPGRHSAARASTFIAHGYLAVDLFFVLSGFVMAMNYKHMFDSGWSADAYLKFLGRRIARVYPLYLACTLIPFGLMSTGIWPHLVECRSLTPTLWLNLFMMQNWGSGRMREPGHPWLVYQHRMGCLSAVSALAGADFAT